MRPLLAATLVATLTAAAGLAEAKTYYVDAQTGADTNDGSVAKPWKSLKHLFDQNKIESRNWASLPYASGAQLAARNAGALLKAGDTIVVADGFYGELSFTGYYNASDITIAAAPSAKPRLSRVVVTSSSNWHIKGFDVSPAHAASSSRAAIVAVESHNYSGPTSKVTVEGCTISTIADISAWSANDWDTKAANGISASGSEITLRDNLVRNINFGISVGASKSLVIGNTVENFSGDGLRGLGDYTVFENNTVRNCYDVNDNHDDGFQSWSRGSDGKVGTGTVTGVVLRGNRIINYTDPNQKLRCTLQGIGMFDGTFVDWVIENNVIITDHWHGISVYGAKNVRIVNNTVLDPNNSTPGPPWIRITNHKNGTAPQGCVVRNNLATDFSSAASGVTEDHNIKITDPSKLFVDVANYDVRLLPTAAAIDQGAAQYAPATDILGVARPQGAGVDVGAYEYSTTPPPPPPPAPDATVDSTSPSADSGASSDTIAPAPDAGTSDDTLTAPASDSTATGDTATAPNNSNNNNNNNGGEMKGGCNTSGAPISNGLPALPLLLLWGHSMLRKRSRSKRS
ncbi:MAG: right-handed parallel beta-helix repeat-containing protein [Myxococcales bacterium]|nr:right-handed parallel beta-helix repeat-containing protein [Myxococcales bacterium]